jgi:hypothetical protein
MLGAQNGLTVIALEDSAENLVAGLIELAETEAIASWWTASL